jgi:adenosylhomocysteine nucleosidase
MKNVRLLLLIIFCLFISINCKAVESKMSIGLICAIQNEAEPILREMQNLKTKNSAGVKYFTGKIGDKNIVLVVGGLGSINAAIATTRLIETFDPDYLLSFGSSGRVDEKLNIGDVVLAESVYDLDYGDPDAAEPSIDDFGPNPVRGIRDPIYFYGVKNKLSFLSRIQHEIHLKDAHDAKGTKVKAKIIIGRIASSDHFPNNAADLKRMQQNNVAAVAMEDQAFMKACWLLRKPCLAVRSISNAIADKTNNPYLAWNTDNESLSEYNAVQAAINLIK